MKVGLAFNHVHGAVPVHRPPDVIAEYDTAEVTTAEAAALAAGGHEVVLLEADAAFGERLARARPDLVFNVAEGRIGAESRESYVPAVCEALAVPYTGSGPLTLALALDKARTKEVLAWRGIATASWQVFASPDEPLAPALRFPLIVKLLHEGSSMGLEPASVVDEECALRAQVARLVSTYREPALVEEFIDGREFSVGLIGNFGAGAPRVMPMIEIVHTKPRSVVLFDPLPPVIDALIAPGRPQSEVAPYRDAARYSYQPICPAPLDPALERRLHDTALATFRALGCRDFCRMELRLRDGVPYVLDVNPIAGIGPGYWFPMMAAAAGHDYRAFIDLIVNAALERLGGRR